MKHILLSSIIVFGIIMFSDANAQSSSDKESSKVFVQMFYDQYNKFYNDDNFGRKYHEDVFSYTFKKKPGYFTKQLLNEYLAYDKALPKQAGEIVGLDFDPIVAAQDNGFDYYAGDVKQKGQSFLVNIYCGQKGKSKTIILKEHVAIVAEVAKENGQWKFVNFYYPRPEGNGANLLALLKSSEKEAKEYTATHSSKMKN